MLLGTLLGPRGLIGSWGPFVFEVSGRLAKTFKEYTEKSSGRWAEHQTMNSTPITEFLGPGLDELEMTIIFSKVLGVEPQLNYEALRLAVRKGEYFPLILGGFPISFNLWRITEVSGTSTGFHPRSGKTMWMETTVSFKEYN